MIIVFYCYFHGLNVPIIRCLGGWNLKRLRAQVLEALIHVVQVAVKTDASEERIEDNSSVRAIVDENPLHVVCMLHEYVWICYVYISTHITHTHIYIHIHIQITYPLYMFTYTDTYKMRVFMHIHFSLPSVLLTCPSSKSQCQAADNKRGMDISAFWVREGGENDWIWVISTSLINMNGKDIRQTAAPFFFGRMNKLWIDSICPDADFWRLCHMIVDWWGIWRAPFKISWGIF